MGLRDLLFGSKDTSSPDEYKDLTLKEYELSENPALLVKVATVTGLRESQYVIITPKNVKISRDRIGGGA